MYRHGVIDPSGRVVNVIIWDGREWLLYAFEGAAQKDGSLFPKRGDGRSFRCVEEGSLRHRREERDRLVLNQ